MNDTSMAALRSFSLANTESHEQPLADFVCNYFYSADPKELEGRGPDCLVAMACAHLRLLDLPRSPSGARVRVFNPTIA